MNRIVASVCTCALLLAQGSSARAQSSSSAAAEQLFQDGKRLLDAGKTHDACEKFAASQEAEQGLGTLLHLAACHEKEGKTASAWAEFNDAMAQAQNRGEKDREKFAREHAQALEKQLHRVVLEMMTRPEGLEIKVDGKVFPQGSLGTALPLDPGGHSLEVRAPKKKPWTQQISLGPGAVTERVEIPALADDPTATAEPGGHPGEDRSARPVVVDPGTPGDPTKRIVGFIVGGAGLALLGVAVLEGLALMSKNSTADDDFNRARQQTNCDTAACPDYKAGLDAHDNAKKAQVYMLLSGGAGVLATGVGVFLVATSYGSAPKRATTGRTIEPVIGPGAIGLRGTF